MWKWKRLSQYVLPILFCLVALGATIAFLVISSLRAFSNFENVLFQLIIAIFSFIGSAWLGYIFSANSNKKNCFSPFRRMCSLYTSIGRVKNLSESYTSENGEIIIAQISAITNEQISATKDALADWQDLIGKDELMKQMNPKTEGNSYV